MSYRVVNSVALASGDPLGSPAHWDAAIDEWLQVVERYGWRPAVLAPTESGADHYARHGMRGMALGEEALLHLDAAARDTLLAQPRIRGARRRGRQADYAVRIRRQRDIDDVEMGHIAVAAARWRGGEDERGFSMALSRMADPSDGDNLVVTAYDGEGELRGILVFVPWSHDGCSLDVMRRSPGAINGVTELMVSSLISDSATLGIRRVSLNFAVLRDTLVRGGRVGAGPLLRAKRRILLLLSHHWQLDSLRRANEKYQPQWRPRFVMWSRRASFTSVLLAIAIAEGFTGRWGRIAAHAEATRDQRFLDAIEVDRQEALRTGVTGLRPALSARAAGVVRLRAQGIDPYPACVPRSAPLNALPAEVSGPISVAGRVVQRRRHGGILFVDIVEDHARLQVVATRSDTEHYALLARVALGDIVSVTGRLGYTRAGQRSVFVTEWTRASSSLRQPPNAWTGLRDPEAQVRLRHIHLATSPDAAELLRSRSRAVQAMRSTLLDEGYLEVETPILQRTHGGANARPFRTHINAYDRELTLRIAPELALKRLIVAGFTQVFEIGRNFRNEGADSTHNPEFTAMEAYRSFADYEDMRVLAERLIREMAVAVTGAQILVAPDGRRVDVSRPWRVVSVCDALSQRMGTTVSPATDIGTLRDLCAVFDVRANPHDGAGTLIELLYEELIEQHTWLPTFYTDFPAETSPLARPHRRTAGLAERWDLVAFGMELGTAYSELVDPMEQRRRLMAQSLRAANGDVEAMQVDEDFLAALEYGMPPTGGLGLGVDRIVMAITGATIRQTLAFPFVR